VSQPTRVEFHRLLASGELFERYAQMENEIARLKAERARLDNPPKATVQRVAEELLHQAQKGNAGHRQLSRWADALIPL
jgi:uncharacterized small protein (DUF1192 family)